MKKTTTKNKLDITLTLHIESFFRGFGKSVFEQHHTVSFSVDFSYVHTIYGMISKMGKKCVCSYQTCTHTI